MGTQPVKDHAFLQISPDILGCGYDMPDGKFCGQIRANHVLSSVGGELKSEAVIVIEAYSEAVRELVRVKDKAYGGAWRRQGYMGNLARILSKAARLEQMMWCDYPNFTPEEFKRAATDPEGALAEHTEAIEDTAKDLIALCAFMMANIEDGNRWGHGQRPQ